MQQYPGTVLGKWLQGQGFSPKLILACAQSPEVREAALHWYWHVNMALRSGMQTYPGTALCTGP